MRTNSTTACVLLLVGVLAGCSGQSQATAEPTTDPTPAPSPAATTAPPNSTPSPSPSTATLIGSGEFPASSKDYNDLHRAFAQVKYLEAIAAEPGLERVSEEEALAAANAVCGVMDRDVPKMTVWETAAVSFVSADSLESMAAAMGLAVGAMCPEHENYFDTH